MTNPDSPSLGTRPDDPYPGRRQSDALTAAELRANPAWWFPPPDGHLTGPDACTVLPIDASGAAADGAVEFPEGRYLLHAVFTLADATTFDGHVTHDGATEPGIASAEPSICAPRGQVPLWHGLVVPDAAHVARMFALLGRPRESVFPVRWRATLHPAGQELTGEARGFAVWREGRVDWV